MQTKLNTILVQNIFSSNTDNINVLFAKLCPIILNVVLMCLCKSWKIFFRSFHTIQRCMNSFLKTNILLTRLLPKYAWSYTCDWKNVVGKRLAFRNVCLTQLPSRQVDVDTLHNSELHAVTLFNNTLPCTTNGAKLI